MHKIWTACRKCTGQYRGQNLGFWNGQGHICIWVTVLLKIMLTIRENSLVEQHMVCHISLTFLTAWFLMMSVICGATGAVKCHIHILHHLSQSVSWCLMCYVRDRKGRDNQGDMFYSREGNEYLTTNYATQSLIYIHFIQSYHLTSLHIPYIISISLICIHSIQSCYLTSLHIPYII